MYGSRTLAESYSSESIVSMRAYTYSQGLDQGFDGQFSVLAKSLICVQLSRVLYYIAWFCTMPLCKIILYIATLNCFKLNWIIRLYTAWNCNVLYYDISYSSVLHQTVLYCSILHCTVCTMLQYTELYRTLLRCSVLLCTVLAYADGHCFVVGTVLLCTVLLCTYCSAIDGFPLYCTIIYCTIVCCTVMYDAILLCAAGPIGPRKSGNAYKHPRYS